MNMFSNEISIVLSGEAGQGLQTTEQILPKLLKDAGYNVFTYSEFMSRIRGGNNSVEIRVSAKRVAAFVERIDIFIPVSENAAERFRKRITKNTLIIGERAYIDNEKDQEYSIIDLPLLESANKLGGKIYANIIALGFLAKLFGITFEDTAGKIKKAFGKAKQDIIEKNILALQTGFDWASEKIETGHIGISIEKNENIRHESVFYGNESIGIGAIAGGCNFIASYPMSPSTGVFTFIAQNSDKFGIVAEQAEDEIAAINMTIGAWYAGANAMVTTSGGGFALMTEGLSLAGAIESPVVIHIGQRPGPATGLPTRTEQADLLMSLYGGHGEFPRAILAPCDKEDGIRLTHHAFDLADKYQVPVIILTDQYFLDSSSNISPLDFTKFTLNKYITKTESDYTRFRITADGISPRGIPGYGDGFIRADSDEHNENGFITEDFIMRTRMVDKRIKKLDALKGGVILPKYTGKETDKYIVVGWGSTYGAILEALSKIGRNDVSFLHFSQVYPLYDRISDFLKQTKRKIIIENNATSQFGTLIRQITGIEFDERILKYNGMPFSVEEIVNKLNSILE